MERETVSGLWLLDKPKGISSRKFGNRVSYKLQLKHLGHTGTLDPHATGLLILLSGYAKKVQNIFTYLPKTYLATIQLGAYSQTDDAEGPIIENPSATPPDKSQVAKVVKSFLGTIQQIPPSYSAIKIRGKRAYALARQGSECILPSRTVSIYRNELCCYDYPQLVLEISCSAGTYIRALARDMGSDLGTKAYLKDLRRLAIGEFHVERAVTLENIDQITPISLEDAGLPYPKIILTSEEWPKIRNGQKIPSSSNIEGEVLLYVQNKVVALAHVKEGTLHPKKLLTSWHHRH